MGLLFALLLAILIEVFRLDAKLSPISDLAKQIQGFLTKQGLQTVLVTPGRGKRIETKGNPLTAQEVQRRNGLLLKGKDLGLTEAEAGELATILEEAARDELKKGAVNPLAFLIIVAINKALAQALIKKDMSP